MNDNQEINCLPSTHMDKNQHCVKQKQGKYALKKIAQKLNKNMIRHIQTEIMDSKITISLNKTVMHHLKQKNLDYPSPIQNRDHLKLSTIVRKKRQLNEQINRLQFQQSKLRQKQAKSVDKNFRSTITTEEISNINQALKSLKMQQIQQQNKVKRLQDQIRLQHIQQQENQNEKIRQNNQQKQKLIALNLKKLKQKQIQRQKLINSLNRDYQEVKKRSPLHEKMQSKWKTMQQQHQIQNKQVLTVLKREKAFSIQQIKSHESKYYRSRKQDMNNLKQKYIRQKNQKLKIELETINHYQSSKFLKTIFQEEKIKKIEEEKRILMMKTLVNKKNKYGQTVVQKFRESVLKNHQLESIEESNQQVLVNSKKKKQYIPVSQEQLTEIGNKYMRQVHSSIDFIPTHKKNVTIPQQQKPAKYQDYLSELKQKRKKQGGQNPEVRQIKEIKSVLNKKTSHEDKLYFAKMIANRMHQRAGSDTKMLLNSINAKLTILESLNKS